MTRRRVTCLAVLMSLLVLGCSMNAKIMHPDIGQTDFTSQFEFEIEKSPSDSLGSRSWRTEFFKINTEDISELVTDYLNEEGKGYFTRSDEADYTFVIRYVASSFAMIDEKPFVYAVYVLPTVFELTVKDRSNQVIHTRQFRHLTYRKVGADTWSRLVKRNTIEALSEILGYIARKKFLDVPKTNAVCSASQEMPEAIDVLLPYNHIYFDDKEKMKMRKPGDLTYNVKYDYGAAQIAYVYLQMKADYSQGAICENMPWDQIDLLSFYIIGKLNDWPFEPIEMLGYVNTYKKEQEGD